MFGAFVSLNFSIIDGFSILFDNNSEVAYLIWPPLYIGWSKM